MKMIKILNQPPTMSYFIHMGIYSFSDSDAVKNTQFHNRTSMPDRFYEKCPCGKVSYFETICNSSITVYQVILARWYFAFVSG